MNQRKKKKKLLLVFVLVFVAIIIRRLYFGIHPNFIITPDGEGYYLIGKDMIEDPGLLINYWRTPVYPLFIQAMLAIRGVFGAPIWSKEFMVGMDSIAFVQGTIGIIGVVAYCIVLLRIGLSSMFTFLLSVFHAANMLVIPWERYLLTETIAGFVSILFLYAFVLLLKKQTIGRFAMYLGISIILPLIKPQLLSMPIIGVLLLVMKVRDVRVFLLSLTVSVCILSVPMGFSMYNGYRYGLHDFQSTGTINILGIALKYRLEPEDISSYPLFGPALRNWNKQDGPKDPYVFLNSIDTSTYYTPKHLKEVRSLGTSALSNNMGKYIVYSLWDFFHGIGETNNPTIESAIVGPAAWTVGALQYIGRIMMYLYFVTIALFPFFAKIHGPKEAKVFEVVTLIGCMTGLQLFVSAIMSYGEYLRIIAPYIPFMFLYGGYCCLWFIFRLPRFWNT